MSEVSISLPLERLRVTRTVTVWRFATEDCCCELTDQWKSGSSSKGWSLWPLLKGTLPEMTSAILLWARRLDSVRRLASKALAEATERR